MSPAAAVPDRPIGEKNKKKTEEEHLIIHSTELAEVYHCPTRVQTHLHECHGMGWQDTAIQQIYALHLIGSIKNCQHGYNAFRKY